MSTWSKGHDRKFVFAIDTVGCYTSARTIRAGRSLWEKGSKRFNGIQGIWSGAVVCRGNVLIVKLVPKEALLDVRSRFNWGAWRWEAS
jgi:hypothetical protein